MLTNIRNLKWMDAAHTTLDLTGDHPAHGSIPFTATASDPEAHGRDLFARAVAGEFGPIAEFVPHVQTDAEFNAGIQAQINALERKEQLPAAVREYLLDIPGASARKGFAKVKQVDDDIAALKAQLRP